MLILLRSVDLKNQLWRPTKCLIKRALPSETFISMKTVKQESLRMEFMLSTTYVVDSKRKHRRGSYRGCSDRGKAQKDKLMRLIDPGYVLNHASWLCLGG